MVKDGTGPKQTTEVLDTQPVELFMGDFQLKDQVLASASDVEKQAAYKKIDGLMRRWITSENTIVLVGAGASMGDDGSGGKNMEKLWDSVKTSTGEDAFSEMLTDVNYPEGKTDLEDLISRLILKKSNADNDGEAELKAKLDAWILKVQAVILKECSFELDTVKNSKHTVFLQKLLNSRKKTAPRLKIFTLNYDTTFEQAANVTDTIVIDGFSFTQNEFSGINFDLDIVKRDKSRIHNEENFYSNVLHLYKLHGSVDWATTKSGGIVRNSKPETPVLIYPNSQKYEESYAMPFFEMISRLQMELRKQSVCLIVVGYSFGDSHINRIITEALNSNFNLELVVVSPSITNKELDKNQTNTSVKALYKRISDGSHNVTLVGDTFSSFTANLPTPQFQQIDVMKKATDSEE